MISDVVAVAWRATGSPQLELAAPTRGHCAQCGSTGDLTPARQVISRNYTNYYSWADPRRPGLCRACSWAFRNPVLRAIPHLISRSPELLYPLDSTGLTDVLSRPLSDQLAVVVPLQPGRKHVVTCAVWGHVITDNALLTWTRADAALLATVHQLRAWGFSPKSLFEPAPPYHALRSRPPGQLPQILDWWEDLAAWRAKPIWLQVACKTRAPQELS